MLHTCFPAGCLHPVATVRGVALCLSYPPPPPIDFFYRISQLLCRFVLCRFHLSFGLESPDSLVLGGIRVNGLPVVLVQADQELVRFRAVQLFHAPFDHSCRQHFALLLGVRPCPLPGGLTRIPTTRGRPGFQQPGASPPLRAAFVSYSSACGPWISGGPGCVAAVRDFFDPVLRPLGSPYRRDSPATPRSVHSSQPGGRAGNTPASRRI